MSDYVNRNSTHVTLLLNFKALIDGASDSCKHKVGTYTQTENLRFHF